MTDKAATAARLAPVVAQLRARRRALKVTQEALAEGLGLSALAVGSWENGKDIPGLDNLVRWAETFGYVPRIEGAPPSRLAVPRPGEPLEAFRLRQLGSALAAAREARGWTQEMVGGKIGVSDWSVHMWETAHRVPRLSRLLAWCDTLDCRLTLADTTP